jgi:CheY-like chemotaxis protein
MSDEPVQVLVVDDGAVTRKLMERRLSALGYGVSCATDGAHALQLLGSALPAIVITDLHMPNLDGLALCREMRRHDRFLSVPVILTGANAVTDLDIQQAKEAGADAFVPRTPTLKEVIAAMSDALERPAGGAARSQPRPESSR